MTTPEAPPEGYTPPAMALWDGRIDARQPRAALRWHQVVAPLDLSRTGASPPACDRGFAFLGYRCDDGIARNLGRPGAIGGPVSIRQRLANLPVGFSPAVALLDAGDVTFVDGPVERAQAALATAVARLRAMDLFPIILGGGHDLTFGHYLGASRGRPPAERLGVVNFDAHFDLRSAEDGASSGTSFWQIARACDRTGRPFEYLCIGVQRSANTVALFTRARELGVEYVLARDVAEHRLDEVREVIDRFAARVGRLIVTLDADVMSSAFCPGVSSAQPLGLDPEIVVRLLKHVLARGDVVSFDVAEVSPRFDFDDNTAKVAAIMIYALVEMLIPDEERILAG
jgi:formiminoglutamase